MTRPTALGPWSESDLYEPLLQWLVARRQLNDESVLAIELPWHGRRVDVAIASKSGATSAFELKLRHNRRALEQSYLNTVTFDRSYLVTATTLGAENLGRAATMGVGVVVCSLRLRQLRLIIPPRVGGIDPRVRTRLRQQIVRRRAGQHVS